LAARRGTQLRAPPGELLAAVAVPQHRPGLLECDARLSDGQRVGGPLWNECQHPADGLLPYLRLRAEVRVGAVAHAVACAALLDGVGIGDRSHEAVQRLGAARLQLPNAAHADRSHGQHADDGRRDLVRALPGPPERPPSARRSRPVVATGKTGQPCLLAYLMTR
jgi:hypothetical protein